MNSKQLGQIIENTYGGTLTRHKDVVWGGNFWLVTIGGKERTCGTLQEVRQLLDVIKSSSETDVIVWDGFWHIEY